MNAASSCDGSEVSTKLNVPFSFASRAAWTSPLMAARHLVRVLGAQQLFEPIHAGEIVTTGTLTPALSIRAGETWTTNLSGIDLPGLTLRFE